MDSDYQALATIILEDLITTRSRLIHTLLPLLLLTFKVLRRALLANSVIHVDVDYSLLLLDFNSFDKLLVT